MAPFNHEPPSAAQAFPHNQDELPVSPRESDPLRGSHAQPLAAMSFSTDWQSNVGAADLLDALTRKGSSPEAIANVERALRLAHYAHLGQERSSGAPYFRHPLLVAKILANRFGITAPAPVIASVLHDAPEDSPERILEALGVEIENMQGASKASAAIAALSKYFNADGDEIAYYLNKLTNPDFGLLLRSQEDAEIDPAIATEAGRLYEAGKLMFREWRAEHPIAANRDPSMKHLFYLGHWADLLTIENEQDRTALAIKLADFFTNAMNFQHVLRDVSIPAEKKEHWRTRYAPVIHTLNKRFGDKSLSISDRVDKYLLSKLTSVAPYFNVPVPRPKEDASLPA